MDDVLVTCDVRRPGTALTHAWEHTVGSGHAPLALRADYQAQLKRCHADLGFRHVRFHGLLCDDVGTLVCEQNRLLYSFFNAESIWDTLLAMDVRPFVELSFMPKALASGSQTVFHYAGVTTPPKDSAAWAQLIRRLTTQAVNRYGRDEVARWLFEVWNEPNLEVFWPATQKEYFDLYRCTARALKDVDSTLRVGGPATADNGWIAEFVSFCDCSRTPLDFVSTHHYPTDAFGQPGDDTEAQLAASDRNVLRDRARETHALAGNRPLFYTEWSTSSNSRDPLHDEPYAAPVIVKTMLQARGLVAGYSWWTFSDIFEETYFPSEPFHGGFGLLTLHGIPKPSYRAFELLHQVGDVLTFAMENMHPTVDAWVVQQSGGRGWSVLLTNHALPRHQIATEHVHVRLDGAPQPAAVAIRRIDADHGYAKARWCALGQPGSLTRKQVDDLDDVSRLSHMPQPYAYENGTLHFELDLPPHAVASVTVDAPGSASRSGSVSTPCP